MKILKEQEINDKYIWIDIRMNLGEMEPLLVVEHSCLNCEGRGCHACYRNGKVSTSFSKIQMKDLNKSLSGDAMKSVKCKLLEFIDLIKLD
jgi:hypothetical protein